jgi:hypothetical protein
MNHRDESKGQANHEAGWETLEPEFGEALKNFKACVDSWSEAMVSRPRTAQTVVVRRLWRLVAGWVLGSVVFAGAVSSGVYEDHRQKEIARIAAAREAERQSRLAAEHARDEEDLLAKVDSDVAREVPSALEPMASLMAADETK